VQQAIKVLGILPSPPLTLAAPLELRIFIALLKGNEVGGSLKQLRLVLMNKSRNMGQIKPRNIMHMAHSDLFSAAEPDSTDPVIKKFQGFTAEQRSAAALNLLETCKSGRFSTILADPPWQFQNRTGKVAPEHHRLNRYSTMNLDDIKSLPVAQTAADNAHLYLWVPNALLPEGLEVMKAWGFQYKSNLIWHKIRKDGGSDGRGVGFYFRNVTEILLFGVRGRNVRTLAPGRSQVNMLQTQKREHSRKPDEQYDLIEACSPGPFLEMFARGTRPKWTVWGNQADSSYEPDWSTYKNHSRAAA
jgi:N6-adenosine-specific RNA methylase IME4